MRLFEFIASDVLDTSSSPDDQVDVLHALLLGLYFVNVLWCMRNPAAPSILAGGVRYLPQPRGRETWMDLGAVHAYGYADCKSLGAGLAAELTHAGVPALPIAIAQPQADGSTDWHVKAQVLATGTLIDPSSILLGLAL